MLTYATALAERNYEVYFLVGSTSGPIGGKLPEQVSIIDLESPRIILAVWKVAQVLKKHRIPVLFSTLTNANLTAVIAGKLLSRNVKVIIREASTPSMAATYHQSKLLYGLAKRLFKRADHFVAVSEAVAQDAINFYHLNANRVTTIYNPNIMERSEQRPNHPFFEVDNDFKVAVGMGRITRVKNFPLLAEAIALVHQQIPEVRLVIIGQKDLDPSSTDILKKRINDLQINAIVSLPGYQTNPADYLSFADLLVLSSSYEGLPNVLIQALACGTPVVSTNCSGGVRDILDNGKTGYIVDDFTPEELAKGIIAQLQHPFPSIENRISKAKEFSLPKSLSQLIQLLE